MTFAASMVRYMTGCVFDHPDANVTEILGRPIPCTDLACALGARDVGPVGDAEGIRVDFHFSILD
ncbi:MAG: hypothetical protein ACKO15_11615, partial [Burkholderiales bacterium]